MAPLPIPRIVAPCIARMASWLFRGRDAAPRAPARSRAEMPSTEVRVALDMRGPDGRPFRCVSIGATAIARPAVEAVVEQPRRRRA